MNRVIVSIILAAAMLSCNSDTVPPYLVYDAPVDDFSLIDQVENVVTEIGQKNGLRVVAKDREPLSLVTDERPAVFVSFFYQNDPILMVTNVGIGEILSVEAYDFGHLPTADLERLLFEVTSNLQDLGFAFEQETGD